MTTAERHGPTGPNRADALTLARLAWRYGMDADDLIALDAQARRALATAAHVAPPSEDSPTWGAAAARLSAMWAKFGHPDAPPHDLADVDAPWHRVTPFLAATGPVVADPEPEPTAPTAIPDGAPRGWAALVALGPLTGHTPARRCFRCNQLAIVGTIAGWRCAAHPPTATESGHGWDWAPNPARQCLDRCYCGRCPQYEPLPPVRAPEPIPQARQRGRRR